MTRLDAGQSFERRGGLVEEARRHRQPGSWRNGGASPPLKISLLLMRQDCLEVSVMILRRRGKGKGRWKKIRKDRIASRDRVCIHSPWEIFDCGRRARALSLHRRETNTLRFGCAFRAAAKAEINTGRASRSVSRRASSTSLSPRSASRLWLSFNQNLESSHTLLASVTLAEAGLTFITPCRKALTSVTVRSRRSHALWSHQIKLGDLDPIPACRSINHTHRVQSVVAIELDFEFDKMSGLATSEGFHWPAQRVFT